MKLQRYELAGTYDDDVRLRADGRWCESADVRRLEESHAELLKALKELYYTVQGEVPSLLDEDSDGNGYLDVEICNAIAKAEGAQS